MWNDVAVLEVLALLAENFSGAALFKAFEPGDDVARGFADVGFEEFIVLPDGKLCSKFTGQVSEFRQQHFFRIPSLGELTAFLCEHGAQDVNVHSDIGNRWTASLQRNTDFVHAVGPRNSPELALLELAREFFGLEGRSKSNQLRTSNV